MRPLMFVLIDCVDYPRNNLYNTNPAFDYGGFRQLVEAQAQLSTTSTLFAYKFSEAGVYSFYLSDNQNYRMVSGYISIL